MSVVHTSRLDGNKPRLYEIGGECAETTLDSAAGARLLSSLQFVLAGLAFGSAGGFTPGPTITLVISQTLRHGVREGFKIAISPLITDAPIILLAIFVLRSIDVEPASLRKGIIANALNPHPWVFWLSVGGPTTLRAAEVGTLAVVLFLVSHYACLVGAKVLVAVLVEQGRSRLGRRYGLAMKFLAAVLVLFAVLFLREGLQSVGLVVRAATP